MKNRLLQLIAAVLVLFAFSKIQAQNFVKLTRANQEQTISLSSDQVLEIQLPRKASTGYIWVEAPAASEKIQKTVAPIGDGEFIHDPVTVTPSNPKGKRVGGSGTQIMRYVGTSQGTTTLTFELKRPWSKNQEVIDSYTITVISAGKYSGTYTPPLKATKHYDHPLTLTPLAGIPASWDWRSQCTPVANQMQCGDCWAFASVGTLECNILITDGVTEDISETFVTNCYTVSGYDGCGGTEYSDAHQCWMASYTGANSNGGGAVYETEDPWTTSEGNGTTGSCGGPYAAHQTIDNYADIGGEDANGVPSVDSIQYHIYYHGPIFIEMDASSNNFNNYTGGILVETGTSTDHCVDLVGWKDTTVSDGSGGYWILRNSWGTDWGVNNTGYMYISYASDLVGSAADYIIYKGGTSHDAPPVAGFTASVTSSCTSGTIQFTDESSNSPSAWAWTFGDGGTSTLQNPSHTYTANGTYTVTLKATNAYGNNTATQTNYITIDMPPAPTVTNGCYSPSTIAMTASGTGTLNWYSSPASTTILYTGASYTPTVTSTTNYYVQNAVTSAAQSAGVASSTLSTSNGSYTNTAREGLVFNADVPLTIQSVMVYEQTAGNRTIVLKNSSGTEIDSITTATTTGSQTVTLNFNVPAGTGYILESPGSSGFWRDKTTTPTYPMTLSGVMSITGCTNATHAAYYYYYYNWQITTSCLSPMTEVNWGACTGINEISQANFEVYPNPNNGSFDIKLNDQSMQNATLSISNMLGQTLLEKKVNNTSSVHIDAANLQQGIYFIKIQTGNATYVKKFMVN
jgi:PKD repeat protein/predicted secreted protein